MLNFSDRAQDVVRSYLDESGGEFDALRITAQPGSPVAPRFELALVALDEQGDDERTVDGPGFSVLVKESDVERLEGATIDFVDRVNESGKVLLTHTKLDGKLVARMAIGGTYTEARHVDAAWALIDAAARGVEENES